MKTMLVTGGTDGIGKALVLRYLQKGYDIVAVGSSSEKGQKLIEEADKLGKKERITFIQANLSLVSENRRIIEMIQQKWTKLDLLVLCVANLNHRLHIRKPKKALSLHLPYIILADISFLMS